MALKFDFKVLLLFYKVIHGLVPVGMPSYLSLFEGQSRLRSTHLDSWSFVSSIVPRNSSTAHLNRSFFFRTHSLWNALPYELRQIESYSMFKAGLLKHMWNSLISKDLETDDCLYDYDLTHPD